MKVFKLNCSKAGVRNIFKHHAFQVFEDGHSSCDTPVPIPNTEVKPAASVALVSYKRRSTDAVSSNVIDSM